MRAGSAIARVGRRVPGAPAVVLMIALAITAVAGLSTPRQASASDFSLLDVASLDCFDPELNVCIKIICFVNGCTVIPSLDIKYYIPGMFIEVIKGPGDSLFASSDTSSLEGRFQTIARFNDPGNSETVARSYDVRVWDISELSKEIVESIGGCLGCSMSMLSGAIGSCSIGSEGADCELADTGFAGGEMPSDFVGGLSDFGGNMEEVMSGIQTAGEGSELIQTLDKAGDMMQTANGQLTSIVTEVVQSGGGYSDISSSVKDRLGSLAGRVDSEDGNTDALDEINEDQEAANYDDGEEDTAIEGSKNEDSSSGGDDGGFIDTGHVSDGLDSALSATCGADTAVNKALDVVEEATSTATMGSVKLAYTTEADILHWRTGCRDLVNSLKAINCIGGRDGESCVGSWGSVYPRQMTQMGQDRIAAAYSAYRALHMAESLGRIEHRISPAGKMQFAVPDVSGCFHPGTGHLERISSLSDDGRYAFIWWIEQTCCVYPWTGADCVMNASG